MKVGDLVRYNAAGQRDKTLGLLLEIKEVVTTGEEKRIVLIQWCVIGDLMPRREHRPGDSYHYEKPKTGEWVWHRYGTWFEAVK